MSMILASRNHGVVSTLVTQKLYFMIFGRTETINKVKLCYFEKCNNHPIFNFAIY